MGGMMYRKGWIVSIVIAGTVIACSKGPATSEGAAAVANAFVKAYYVDTDIKRSMNYCEGFACATLQKELKLREGQVISGDTKRPYITTKLKKTLQGAEGKTKRFIYHIVVKPAGIEAFERESYVKVAEHDGNWRVTQFGELKNAF